MGVLSQIGTGIARTGGLFGLPEFGISERFGATPETIINPTGPNINPNIISPIPASQTAIQAGGTATGFNSGIGFVPEDSTAPSPNQPVNNTGGGGGDSELDQLRKIIADTGGDPTQRDRLSQLEGQISGGQDQLKADIENSWNQYLSALEGESFFIGDQRTAQEDILQSQLTQGQDRLNQQRSSSLRDIAGNIRNAFQAGNNYLGSIGAGDSSAANQYQFALTQEANKQRAQVNEFVNGQLNNLQALFDQGMSGIAQWFADSQSQLQQLISQGQLNKQTDIQNVSRDILNQAIATRNQLQQDATNRKNALMEWAMNNASNVSQLAGNIASIPQGINTPVVDSSGNLRVPTGYGGSEEDRPSLFQNQSFV